MRQQNDTSPHPEILLTNAQVVTLDPRQPLGHEIGIRDGRILHVGRHSSGASAAGKSVHVIDCRGSTVLPGFVDAHLHILSYAESLLSMNMRPGNGVRSIFRIQDELRHRVGDTPPGEWLKGKGYDEFSLEEKRHPTRWELDTAAPAHPVKLTHRSGHAHVLNSLALKMVGIGRDTPDPPGGLIERDLESGEPTGVLFEMSDTLAKRIPRWDDETFEQAVRQATTDLASVGITSFLDASPTGNLSKQGFFQQLRSKSCIPQRIFMTVGQNVVGRLGQKGSHPGKEPNDVTIWGVKLILDRTTGTMCPSQAELAAIVLAAHSNGWPVAIHAVEEETIEAALEALETVQSEDPLTHRLSHRIEHASICPPHLARRMGGLGLTVVSQPSFIYYHGTRYTNTIESQQQAHLYPHKTLLSCGVTVAGSSDCPIVPPSPLTGIYAAVTRLSMRGECVGPEQKISIEEAIALYTTQAAKAIGAPASLGRLSPGMAADLVVLSRNPLTTPPANLRDIEVQLTMVGGRIVYSR
ncbi:MAG: amidohydrolase [Deferrisomatales bacterium]|nr:amidohydrolase [Deferrisomatales bacterium]